MVFESLSDKLQNTLSKLRGKGKLSEKDIDMAMREVKLALLEADVNFKVVKDFIKNVKQRSLGAEVLESLTPGQQVIKIVNEELTSLMGTGEAKIDYSKKPTVIMMSGLQGAGKTTTSGKLANMMKKNGNDVVIIDTAGRLHIDETLMDELIQINDAVNPSEILLVLDAMTGQDAVNVAAAFDEKLSLSGVILTKLDGDARGGAALSIRAVTDVPIKFIAMGEKMDQIEVFHPDRMASRILGMGDVLSLIEKAQEAVDEKKAQELEKKIREQSFTLDDFLEQIEQMRNLGPIEDLLGMIPGMNNKMLKNVKVDDKEFVRVEAIIKSMTKEERIKPEIIDISRRKRIANGSGTTPADVNKLLKQFKDLRKMMKQFGSMGKKLKKRKFGMPFPF